MVWVAKFLEINWRTPGLTEDDSTPFSCTF
jgi:hypothetical protein